MEGEDKDKKTGLQRKLHVLRVVLVNLDGYAKETRMYFVLMLWLSSTYNVERGVQLSLK